MIASGLHAMPSSVVERLDALPGAVDDPAVSIHWADGGDLVWADVHFVHWTGAGDPSPAGWQGPIRLSAQQGPATYRLPAGHYDALVRNAQGGIVDSFHFEVTP